MERKIYYLKIWKQMSGLLSCFFALAMFCESGSGQITNFFRGLDGLPLFIQFNVSVGYALAGWMLLCGITSLISCREPLNKRLSLTLAVFFGIAAIIICRLTSTFSFEIAVRTGWILVCALGALLPLTLFRRETLARSVCDSHTSGESLQERL